MALKDVLSQVGMDFLPDAVLWDMDGTIVDTEEDWGRLTYRVVKEAGGVWTDEDAGAIFGASTPDHAARIADAIEKGTGVRPDPIEAFGKLGELMKTEAYPNIELLPGVRELLLAFREAGVAQSLVTATEADLVDVALGALGETYFNSLVTGSDDVPGKPDPAPFLLAARRLEVRPERALIFEDSPAGLAAARASGSHVVDVNKHNLAELAALL